MINLIKQISVLQLRKNDILVVECDRDITNQEYKDMSNLLVSMLEHVGVQDVGVFITGKDMKLKIIRSDKSESRLLRKIDVEKSDGEKE